MSPDIIVEWVNSIVPWVEAFSSVVGIALYKIILPFLGTVLIITRLTPTEKDNAFVQRIIIKLGQLRAKSGNNKE